MVPVELLLHLSNAGSPSLDGLEVDNGCLVHRVCEGPPCPLMPVGLRRAEVLLFLTVIYHWDVILDILEGKV